MTFRTKLLLITTLTVAGTVALATGAVSLWTRRTFERMDQERRQALVRQFEKDLAVRGKEVVVKVERAAGSDLALRAAMEAGRANPDLSLLLNDARTLAEQQGLDFVDVVQGDMTIVSSAHWSARFGYKNDWPLSSKRLEDAEAFLTRVAMPEDSAIALAAVRSVSTGGRKLYVLGAKRLDASFLATLGTAPGTRTMLWLSPKEIVDATGPVQGAERLAGLVAQVESSGRENSGVVQWTGECESAEAIQGLPLKGGGGVLGVLLVATSLREQVQLQKSIQWTGLLVGASGILLGLLIGLWTTERVTRPVEQLAAGARRVARGDWSARVPVSSQDEIGELALAFNMMTAQLIEQRDRAIQAERVAAWRELARRLAHELKNPLFPLQITVENLRKARSAHPEAFEELFEGCTGTLLEELKNLRTIIERFSDFAKMPVPQKESVDLNDVVRGVMKLFEAQFQNGNGPRIEMKLGLAEQSLRVKVDREQMSRALKNLVLNAMDAMPAGGTLSVRTERERDGVSVQVADSGQGLTQEECERLFTPYYTTKRHGTGLGLAIVQSVVSDHGGKITVSSEPGQGACFRIVLPLEGEA